MSLSLILQAYAIESDDGDCDSDQENRHEKDETVGGDDDNKEQSLPEGPVVMSRGKGNKKRHFSELQLASNSKTNFAKRTRKKCNELKSSSVTEKHLLKDGRGDDKSVHLDSVKPDAKPELPNTNGLPFTRCKIVLKLDAQPGSDGMGHGLKSNKTGWKRKGDQFIFYEAIPHPSKNKGEAAGANQRPEAKSAESSTPEPELKEEVRGVKCGRGRPRKVKHSSSDIAHKKEAVPPPGEIIGEDVPKVKGVDRSALALIGDPANEDDKDDDDDDALFPDSDVILQNEEAEFAKLVTPSIPLVYKCPFCFTRFGNSGDLIKHLPTHSTQSEGKRDDDGGSGNDTNKIKVRDDQVAAKDSAAIDKPDPGILSSNSNEATLEMLVVESPFPTGGDKEPGAKSHRRKCRKCSYTTKRMFNLRQHMNIHDDTTGKPFKCSSCPSYFKNQQGLRLHEICVHLADKQEQEVTMAELGEVGSKKTELVNVALAPESTATADHQGQPKHTGKASHPPTKACTVNVTRCDDLLRKMKMRNKKAQIRKKTPDRKLPTQGRINVPTSSPSKPNSEVEKAFQCVKCSKAFGYQSELSRHMVWAHFKISRIIKKKRSEGKQGSSRSRMAAAAWEKYVKAKASFKHAVKKHT